MYRQLFLIPLCATIIASCSDGTTQSQTENLLDMMEQDMPSEIVPSELSGGLLGNPTQMDERKIHNFFGNEENNYFTVGVEAGETLYIHATLNQPLEDRETSACSANPTLYTGINLVDTGDRACANDFKHEFETSGMKTIKIGYLNENFGFFNYSITNHNLPAFPLPANGSGGTPRDPRYIDVNGENQIVTNNLLNFYAYEAIAGETISIVGELSDTIDARYRAGCEAAGHSYSNRIAYGISVDSSRYSCDRNKVYQFTESGIHMIHFKFYRGISGVFLLSSDRDL